MFRYVASAATLCILTASPARAQLYSWKDAAGRLVISDSPRTPAARVYAVGSGTFAVTKPAGSGRTSEYDALITQHASVHALSPDFVRAVIQAESAFNPRARSTKGAMGLMQLMPDTARQYGVKDPYDPESNIEGGIKYLKALLERLPRDLAIAAYNAGEAAVERFHGIPPYPETRNYVSRIVQLLGR